MPSVKFESNGGSSYDNECSYCDAVSFDDARSHKLAPILIIALQLKYYQDQTRGEIPSRDAAGSCPEK
jgi:hypothetical protein